MNSDTLTPTTTYTLCVRSYWDKRHGNSYFSMRIVGTDGTNHIIPITYGHGETTYMNNAFNLLGLDWNGMDWAQRRAIMPVVDISEVTRERDLHKVEKK